MKKMCMIHPSRKPIDVEPLSEVQGVQIHKVLLSCYGKSLTKTYAPFSEKGVLLCILLLLRCLFSPNVINTYLVELNFIDLISVRLLLSITTL